VGKDQAWRRVTTVNGMKESAGQRLAFPFEESVQTKRRKTI